MFFYFKVNQVTNTKKKKWLQSTAKLSTPTWWFYVPVGQQPAEQGEILCLSDLNMMEGMLNKDKTS